MMTIDYALRIYTDMVNAGENIDIAYFQDNLSKDDFKEFQELTPFIALIKSTKLNGKFQKTFKKVNDYKEALYDTPSVANFRSQRHSDNEDATKKLDKIFDEEFGDE